MGADMIAVAVETGTRRVFASALDWPGWSRAAKTEQQALEILTAYLPRYRLVAERAGLSVPAEPLEVVERVAGNASTDFGVPGAQAAYELRPLEPGETQRMASLMRAAWDVFDEVVAGAPAELRKGPRGGGRDRDKIVEHVLGAEQGYARSLGLRLPAAAVDDAAAIADARQLLVNEIAGRGDAAGQAPKKWPVRYAARRIAWHVLDHAWEIQDRST